jgi:aryl-alcohol dehydrogenase-like predicted oxidoreductase
MEHRQLGRTDMRVSAVSFGAWAIGGGWGKVDDAESYAALNRAIDLGVNFIDTADVYGDGRSEKLIGQLLKGRKEEIFVATKAGGRLSERTPDGYNLKNLEMFVDRSLSNLGVNSIDLLQLHCPPTEVYYRGEVFEALDNLKRKGKIRFYGVSVRKVSEALKAIEYPDLQSVQIIFNMFRLKPATEFFPAAKERKVGVNRYGKAFDRGETFSGVDLQKGLAAVDRLRGLVPAGMTLAQFALRWILMFDAVSCAIPGAKRPQQAEENSEAASLPALDPQTMKGVQSVYDQLIRPEVHALW